MNKTPLIDWESRIRKIRELSKKQDKKNFKMIREYLKDKNDLVRIEAIESLYQYGEYLQEKDIVFLLNDDSYLVRSYAIGLYYFFPKAKTFIKQYLETQKSTMVKIEAYFTLYELGEKQYLEKIINILLNTKQYRVRCAIVNTLYGYINRNNFRTIIQAFIRAKQNENTLAVSSSLNKYIYLIHKRFKKSLQYPNRGNGV